MLLLALACEQPFSCCAKRGDAESGYLGCEGASTDEQPGKCPCYGLLIGQILHNELYHLKALWAAQRYIVQPQSQRSCVVAEPLWSR